MTDHVEIARDGGVQTLRLNRPEKLNALTRDMYRALSDALEAGDRDDDVRAHVFLGADGVFTAGNDIADFLGAAQAQGGMEEHVTDVLRFIFLLPVVKKPMIAAVDGPAVGVGTTLLFHCDLVYASERASFQTPFLDLGLVPEGGSSMTMPARMGYARAFEMLVLGETYDAPRMLEAGLLNAIVASDELEGTAMKAARKLARKPPEALAIARSLLRPNPELLVEKTQIEARAFQERLQSKEAQAAFNAFLSKS